MSSAPGKPAAFIFEMPDCFRNTVGLAPDRWQHIVEFHPEMEGLQDVIAGVVADPTQISTSTRQPLHFIFDGHKRLLPSPKIVRVVIKYMAADIKSGSTTGQIVTAYGPMRSNTGEIGEVIYFAGVERKTR